MNHNFIYQETTNRKVKKFLIFVFILLLLLTLGVLFSTVWYKFAKQIPFASGIINIIGADIINLNLRGVFYANLIGGLFFAFTPDELIFYFALMKSNSLILTFIFATLGYVLAQVLNYYMGLKISPYVIDMISKRKIYKTRRYVNKYGGYGIFFFNLLPLPGPLLTFALGITKYNFKRLMILTILGKGLKYGLTVVIYIISYRFL